MLVSVTQKKDAHVLLVTMYLTENYKGEFKRYFSTDDGGYDVSVYEHRDDGYSKAKPIKKMKLDKS
jgi:hypothetical protein